MRFAKRDEARLRQESCRVERTPETTSASPSAVRTAGRSAGSFCPSPSMVTMTSPWAWAKPAARAALCPSWRFMRMPRTSGDSAAARRIHSRVPSSLRSSTRRISHGAPSLATAWVSSASSVGKLSLSLKTGMTIETCGSASGSGNADMGAGFSSPTTHGRDTRFRRKDTPNAGPRRKPGFASMRHMLTGGIERHLQAFREGVEDLLPEDELIRKLERAFGQTQPLRIKQGFDPTAPDIHLGHTIGLRKLRQLQDLGHRVVVVVGDYTGLVGDPSGRSRTRPQLSIEEIEANAETYLDQFFRIGDRDKTEMHRNGEWFAKMHFTDVLRLTSRYTVARLLERDDFAKRLQAHEPISVHELLYPIMQGWDSVEIRSD